jgi:hypothetical protein
VSAPRRDLVRVAAARTGVPSTRAQLRQEISRVVQRKMSASQRIGVRRWAGEVVRTDAELAEKLAELLRMGDLPQRKGN